MSQRIVSCSVRSVSADDQLVLVGRYRGPSCQWLLAETLSTSESLENGRQVSSREQLVELLVVLSIVFILYF